jgi:undecaprenyl-diphosphatase
MPELIIIVILGLVEGLTEFIPVSSTGHLILFGDAFGFKGERAGAFDVFIQLGAILAVLVLYFSRFRSLLNVKDSALDENKFSGRSGILKLILVSIPALVLGFALHHYIKENLFTTSTVVAALLVGGVFMIAVEKRGAAPKVRSIENISFKTAFIIGLFQCFSLWPGMSRSGSTIVGGMLLGLERSVAAEFSFLAAVPIMFAATGYDMLKSLKFLSSADIFPFGLGFVVAFVSAMLAIKFFISLLRRCTLVPFAIYRIALALIIIVYPMMR